VLDYSSPRSSISCITRNRNDARGVWWIIDELKPHRRRRWR